MVRTRQTARCSHTGPPCLRCLTESFISQQLMPRWRAGEARAREAETRRKRTAEGGGKGEEEEKGELSAEAEEQDAEIGRTNETCGKSCRQQSNQDRPGYSVLETRVANAAVAAAYANWIETAADVDVETRKQMALRCGKQLCQLASRRTVGPAASRGG